MKQYFNENLPKLNRDQLDIYNSIIEALNSNKKDARLRFVDGPGGTVKYIF